MAKVLTEQEVITTGGLNPYEVSYDRYKCCTRARAEALNCTVTDPSNAVSNQLVCGVSKTHNYVLTVPSTSKYTSGSAQSYTITSTKDGASFYGVTVYSKSSTISNVTIKPAVNNTTALVMITWASSGNTSGWVTLMQNESYLVGTTNISK